MYHVFTCHLKDGELEISIMMARVIIRNSTIILRRIIKVKYYISGPQQGLIFVPQGSFVKVWRQFHLCQHWGTWGDATGI